MPLTSMTGHGLGRASLGDAALSVEVRSVNHRHFDARVRFPLELADHAGRTEARARSALLRGRVEILGRLDGTLMGSVELDRERARSAYEELRALRDELAPDEPLPLTLLAGVPELFRNRPGVDEATTRAAVDAAVDAACAAAVAMRAREGEALTEAIRADLAIFEDELGAVEARLPEAREASRTRFLARVGELLDGPLPASVDPGRLEVEIALAAERSDVAEEVARASSHAREVRALLDAQGEAEPAGKRLDFLLQEMSREVSTLGAKTSDREIGSRVIELKSAVARMREQAQNVL